jgi:hypothetical protein
VCATRRRATRRRTGTARRRRAARAGASTSRPRGESRTVARFSAASADYRPRQWQFYVGFAVHASTAFGWLFMMRHLKLGSIYFVSSLRTSIASTCHFSGLVGWFTSGR